MFDRQERRERLALVRDVARLARRVEQLSTQVRQAMVDNTKILAAAQRAEAGMDTMVAVISTLRDSLTADAKRIADLIAANDPTAAAEAQKALDDAAQALDDKTTDALGKATEEPPNEAQAVATEAAAP